MTMTTLEPRTSAPKDNLRRQVEFRAADEPGDGLTLEGYAATFGDWTEIHDRAGSFQERIAPGAFKRTLGQRMPVLQFDHGTHPLIGSIPLGRFTKIEEDARGLFVRARLSDNWLIEPVRDSIRDGGVTGMSFRFRVVDDQWENRDDTDYRTITEVELYEAGPVVHPAYESTSVGVRSRQTALALTDPEVRTEVAHLLTLSTDDIRHLADESPATDPDPAAGHSESVEAPAVSHATTRTQAQRQAIAALALSPRKETP